jgi:hypothetical protein
VQLALLVSVLYLFATHIVQVPPFGPVYPGMHAQSVSSSLCAGELLFDGQKLHALCPTALAYRPVAHDVHNPPGNPKAKFYRANGKAPEAPEKWMAKAEEHAGSWWPHWAEWLKARAGAEKSAPTELGSKAHPPVGAAPGQYVFD